MCFPRQWDYAQPYTPYLAVVSSILNLFFMLEVVMKMVAFSARGYWQSRRNRYDLFVTVLGLVWVILNFTFPMVSKLVFSFVVVSVFILNFIFSIMVSDFILNLTFPMMISFMVNSPLV